MQQPSELSQGVVLIHLFFVGFIVDIFHQQTAISTYCAVLISIFAFGSREQSLIGYVFFTLMHSAPSSNYTIRLMQLNPNFAKSYADDVIKP